MNGNSNSAIAVCVWWELSSLAIAENVRSNGICMCSGMVQCFWWGLLNRKKCDSEFWANWLNDILDYKKKKNKKQMYRTCFSLTATNEHQTCCFLSGVWRVCYVYRLVFTSHFVASLKNKTKNGHIHNTHTNTLSELNLRRKN